MSFWNKLSDIFKPSVQPSCTFDQKAVQKEMKALQKEEVKVKEAPKPTPLAIKPPEKVAPPQNFLTDKEQRILATCHPHIQEIVLEVVKEYPIKVLEGSRSKATQDAYFMKGTSKVKWPKSNHNTLVQHIKDEFYPKGKLLSDECSLAVDIVPHPIDWNDTKRFHAMAVVVKRIAKEKKIPLEWGFDKWGWDMPHFELSSYRDRKK